MKKLIGIVVALALVLAMLPVAAFAANNYYVAGVSALCGSNWSQNDAKNVMTANGDVYTKTYSNVKVGTYEFKITDGTWDNSWGDGSGNYKFAVTTAGDITITFNSSTKKITVSGTGVGEAKMEIKYVTAVGAGKGGFLNNVDWNPAAASNKMTEENGVYTITYTDVAAGTYEYKFAANGAWTDNWGFGGTTESGKTVNAVYNSGSNAKVVVAENGSTVELKLDLSAMDSKGNGAKITATVTAPAPEPEPEPEIMTYDIIIGGFNRIQIPGESYANIVVDATAGDIALSIQGSYDTYLVDGMDVIYPNRIGIIEHILMGGSSYTLKLCTVSVEGEFAMVNASSMAPGSMNNPAELVMGENIANAPAGDAFYYDWTASEDGVLSLSVDTSKYTDWAYSVFIERADGTYFYGEGRFGSEGPSSDDLTVYAGDLVHINVGTESWAAGVIGLNASFAAGIPGGDEGGEGGEGGGEGEGDTDGNEMVSVTDEAVTVDAPWTYTFTATTTGTLHITNSEGVCYKIYGLDGPDSESLRYTSSKFSAGTAAAYRVSVPGEITVKVWAYDYGEVDGTISCSLSFIPDEGDVEVEKDEYIISDIVVDLGENYLTLDPTAITTVYEFCPAESGVYKFIVNNAMACVGYWGAGSFFVTAPTGELINSMEYELANAGPSIMVGISDVEGEFTLTIEKIGDAEGQEQVEYVDYENVHVPSDENLVDITDEKVNDVDITKPQTVVKDENGFYHLGSVDGPMIYVDLVTEMNLLDAFFGGYGALTMRGEYNGTKYNFLDAMRDYASVVYNSELGNGLYPLTDDLMAFVNGYGAYQGWFMDGMSPFANIDGTQNADSAWLAACVYLGEEIVDEPETPEEPEVTPDTGDYSIAGLVVAMMAATAGAIIIGKKKEF